MPKKCWLYKDKQWLGVLSIHIFLCRQTWNLPVNFWFCSFQIHVYNKKEKGCQSQSPSITTLLRFYFVKPIWKKMQSNPGLINHLGLPMQIHFLKSKIQMFCNDLGPSSHQIHSHVHGQIYPKKCLVEVFLMEKMTDQTFFWKHTCFFFLNQVFLNKIYIFFE